MINIMSPIQVKFIYFDLDDTLCNYWDSAKSALLSTIDDVVSDSDQRNSFFDLWCKEFDYVRRNLKSKKWYSSYLESDEDILHHIFKHCLDTHGLDQHNLALEMSKTYHARRLEKLSLFDNAEYVLEKLSQSYQLGLITNGPKHVQRSKIQKLNIESFFKVILIEGELGYGKPDAAVYEDAERLAQCDSKDILMVGNTYNQDIRPPLQRGWKAIWIQRDSDIPFSLRLNKPNFIIPPKSPKPSYIIHHLSELFDYV